MPSVRIMVSPPVGEEFRDQPFHLHPKEFEFSRVPCVGEILDLGNDEKGHAANYRVLMVHQSPTGSSPVDAELYAKRVELRNLLREVGLVV